MAIMKIKLKKNVCNFPVWNIDITLISLHSDITFYEKNTNI